jgi:hypothetical protein
VCVGVSCLDLMLLGATGEGEAFGTINTYQQQVPPKLTTEFISTLLLPREGESREGLSRPGLPMREG